MGKQMYHYATVTRSLEELKQKGFTTDFNLQEDRIINTPEEFTIEEVYRYEGETDPGDEATIYGIRSNKGEKGFFLIGFAAYAENDAAMVLNELFIKGRQEEQEGK